jgi:hypothetical protein
VINQRLDLLTSRIAGLLQEGHGPPIPGCSERIPREYALPFLISCITWPDSVDRQELLAYHAASRFAGGLRSDSALQSTINRPENAVVAGVR